jgi:hypothetical protein
VRGEGEAAAAAAQRQPRPPDFNSRPLQRVCVRMCVHVCVHVCAGIDPDTVLWTSSKTGAGINEILPAVAARLPGADGSADARLQVQ